MPELEETEAAPTGESLEASSWNCQNLQSVMSSCHPINLKFIDVCYKVKVQSESGGIIKKILDGKSSAAKEVSILSGITGMASPGEILAVLGPSGSGKSTLLNVLAGRLPDHSYTGSVVFNGKKIDRSVLKKTGFVAQDDVLYPRLTVRETLVFCSLLRLPSSLSKREKVFMADSVILKMGLEKCKDTIIGNGFIRGVSGGERKRVSIGHEMLVNPSLLILDEPTSGLDATSAYCLVSTLGSLAWRGGRTVVMSVHQPSSRVYQIFDTVLVLSEGRCIYFGKGSDAASHFESVGFRAAFPMNPADFLLDLANGVCQVEGMTEKEMPCVKQSLVLSYNSLLAPKVKEACQDTTISPNQRADEFPMSSEGKRRRKSVRALSSWFYQFTILLQRSLKERRHEMFDSLRIFQVVAASLLAGFMWWHSDFRDTQDRLGLLFFVSIFWGVLPSFNAVFAFPQDRAIFMKERASGMYSLSSYFMSRVVGDLPMELTLPTLFLVIVYWMCGLKPHLGAFILTLTVVLGYVLVSQGLGLAIGALIMDAKKASTIVMVTMLAFVLAGGFYVHKLPSSVSWIKYISTTYYCYRLLIDVQYGRGKEVWSVLDCDRNGGTIGACRFVTEDIAGQIDPAVAAAALIVMFFAYRLLAYFALRCIKA